MGLCCSKSEDFLETDADNPRYNPRRPQRVIPYPEPLQISQVMPLSSEIPIIRRGIEPNECDIDGGVQIVIKIHDEAPRSIPYAPRVGRKLAPLPSRQPTGTIVCDVPPASEAGSVGVTFWGEESDGTVYQVPSAPYEFNYKDRSERKV